MIDLRPIVNSFALRCLAIGLGAVLFVVGLVALLPSPRVEAQAAGLSALDVDRLARSLDRYASALDRHAAALDRNSRACGR